MSSANKGVSAIVKEQQPKAPYVHCRGHCINLSIACSCKNEVVRALMDDISSVCYFFANSPKRQQFFERFITFYKEDLKVCESNRSHIIGLSKTRWVERFKAYDNYFILYKFVVSVFESINNRNMYIEFYEHLETEINENWYWDRETQGKAQGLFVACRRFDRLVAFAVLFNGLEPMKPLVTKLQKRNRDIYQAYHMIDRVVSDLSDVKKNIENEFSGWYKFAVDMGASVGVQPNKPRTTKCWSKFRNNVPSTDFESYYRRSIAIPVMDNLISDFVNRMADRSHTELFSLLPSVCLSKQFDFDNTVDDLIKNFGDDLKCNIPTIFRSELGRWIKQWEIEMEKRKIKQVQKNSKSKNFRVDGKESYSLNDPPDSFLECLEMADADCYPNIRQLLIIGCISPIGSTEAERAASGIRRLKTPYRTTMSDEREGDLRLIQLQKLTEIDDNEVIDIFINLHRRRLFTQKI